jgi:hypothetical protein
MHTFSCQVIWGAQMVPKRAWDINQFSNIGTGTILSEVMQLNLESALVLTTSTKPCGTST